MGLFIHKVEQQYERDIKPVLTLLNSSRFTFCGAKKVAEKYG
jgi:hypothetical protein